MAKSIREYVSEKDLTLEIYRLNFSRALRDLKTKTQEEIIEQFKVKQDKILKSIKKDLVKYSNDSKVLEYLGYNYNYVKNLEPLISQEQIFQFWEEQVELYKSQCEENEEIDEDLFILKDNVSSEKFGEMVILIINNLGTKPCFSGYTRNWKDDFYSSSVEDILKYISNFDNKLLSKRTGKPRKAFAYITQIAYNAFLTVIKDRKTEQEKQKKILPYEIPLIDGDMSVSINSLLDDEEDYIYEQFEISEEKQEVKSDIDEFNWVFDEDDSEITDEELDKSPDQELEFINDETSIEEIKGIITINSDSIEDINNILNELEESNNNHIFNKAIKSEIDYLHKNTPIEDKNSDFSNYIKSLTFRETKYNEVQGVKIIMKEPKIINTNKPFKIFITKGE